jgi:hypothetical protein
MSQPPFPSADFSTALSRHGAAFAVPFAAAHSVGGLAAVAHVLPEGSRVILPALKGTDSRVLLFVRGRAEVATPKAWRAASDGLALVALPHGGHAACSVHAVDAGAGVGPDAEHAARVEFLEVLVAGYPGDAAAVAASAALLPCTAAAAAGESHALLPEGAVPRFAAGCVQIAGTGAAHDVTFAVDRLVLGLPGCAGSIAGGGASVPLAEWTLAVVPRGTAHCVGAPAGAALNYAWFDLAHDAAGVVHRDFHAKGDYEYEE